ncbi:MAG TPA: PH domain-containing protein [Pseudolysinimonas sp.]|jgi:membrane protein YdbS with pleckstrin-like domain
MADPASPETVVARLRPSARALVLPTVALLADLAAVSYFGGSLNEQWMTLAVFGAGALVLLLLFLLPVVRWLSWNYTITTRRIVIRSGILVRTRQELLHSRGYDVTVRRSGLQLLFRSGDVLINAGLEHPVLLRDVPHADLVQSALHDLMEAGVSPIGERRRREQSRPFERETGDGETGEQDRARDR